MTPRTWTAPRLAVAAAITLSATGCATGLDQLPLPAPGLGGDTYTLTAAFSNALNLPEQAKVTLNGADIGQVESMSARDYTALVTLRITSSVRLPVGTSAQLRSATPMGDVFVAMKPPPVIEPGTAVLGDGGAITLESTSAASTIEEMLTRASLLVNGGTIQYLTTVVAALSEHVGGRGDRLAALLDETRALLGSLSARTDQINGVLYAATDLSGTLAARQTTLADTVAAAGPAVEVLAENTDSLVTLVDRVHTITTQLARFPSVQGTNTTSMAANINQLAAGLNAAALNPQADLGAVNDMIKIVLKMISGPNGHVAVDIAELAIPDPANPGGVGGRAPDITDWTAFVGSLQHMIDRLGGRLTGAPR
ncbi:MlaD family protein [Nocardia fluminea]|uniref:Virulence factor Mce-like protein n=1 Tax=Nocardia fluminea TaxID=134984 RepID=A0A2N3VKT3_9NOCA|nr:MlaD family protein [Nocardia fluminea]PKV82235.1 virulence factor Mce-like protein [Nocardia fluminea]